MSINNTESRIPGGFTYENAKVLGFATDVINHFCLISYLPETLRFGETFQNIFNQYVVFADASELGAGTDLTYAWTIDFLDSAGDIIPTHIDTAGYPLNFYLLNLNGLGLIFDDLPDLKYLEVTCSVIHGGDVTDLTLTHVIDASYGDILDLFTEAEEGHVIAKGGNPAVTHFLANLYRDFFPFGLMWGDRELDVPTNVSVSILYSRLLKFSLRNFHSSLTVSSLEYEAGLNHDDLAWSDKSAKNQVGLCGIKPYFLAMMLERIEFRRLDDSVKEEDIFNDYLALSDANPAQLNKIDIFNYARFPKSNILHAAYMLSELKNKAQDNDCEKYKGSDVDRELWKTLSKEGMAYEKDFIRNLLTEYCIGPQDEDIKSFSYSGLGRPPKHDWAPYVITILQQSDLSSVFTVCFSGTACTRDEGEVTRPKSDKNIYTPETGYIPVRIHLEITGNLLARAPSVTIRGVGENDWAEPRDDSEPLVFDAPLNADPGLLSDVQSYSGGNQYSFLTQLNGWSAPALALHAANLAAASGMEAFNFIGHSRGGVSAIMAAWFIYVFGEDDVKSIPINIFAIDPVPGTGEWYGIFTQLPPNVVNYVGIYAWDMCIQLDSEDPQFMGLVPRPNGLMTGKDNEVTPKDSTWWSMNDWKHIADDAQLTDPLKPGTDPQPIGYDLYSIRGRHSTVSGNYTADSKYDPVNVSETVAPVSRLIYKMARGYLTKWGTTFPTGSAVDERVLSLRKKINTDHREFDAMGGGDTRTSILPLRPYVRRLSSIHGINPANSYYMDDVVGDPPYKMVYPVTKDRKDAGWVKWKFL